MVPLGSTRSAADTAISICCSSLTGMLMNLSRVSTLTKRTCADPPLCPHCLQTSGHAWIGAKFAVINQAGNSMPLLFAIPNAKVRSPIYKWHQSFVQVVSLDICTPCMSRMDLANHFLPSPHQDECSCNPVVLSKWNGQGARLIEHAALSFNHYAPTCLLTCLESTIDTCVKHYQHSIKQNRYVKSKLPIHPSRIQNVLWSVLLPSMMPRLPHH